MKTLWIGAALAVLAPVSPARAEEKPKIAPKSFQVPFRLTLPKHLLVRAKLNGKGPFNFILDTGAPALFVATATARKVGVEADSHNWGVFDRVEIEGGVVLDKVKARVEDPFQLEGMNGLGLAGAELHGVIGYNVLARYRIEIDFTRDKMIWTPLDYEPKVPVTGGRGGAGGLEVIGSIMKVLGGMLGRKAAPEVTPRGFLGIELEDGEELPAVKAVLAGGPAAKAGVKAGDRISHIQGRSVLNSEDVLRLAKKLLPGAAVTLTVKRGSDTQEIRFQAAEGL
jgi:hypothetical protein